MRKLLGDVYTYGNFTYKAVDLFEKNNIFDWDNKTNVCYTAPDISGYPSIKPFGGASISIDKSDEDIVDEVLGTDKERLLSLLELLLNILHHRHRKNIVRCMMQLVHILVVHMKALTLTLMLTRYGHLRKCQSSILLRPQLCTLL